MSEETALIDEAKRVAFETASRREAGDDISDEQVIADNPHLADHLPQHLERLRRLRAARDGQQTVIEAKGNPVEVPDDAVEGESFDIRMTAVVDAPGADDDDLRGTMIVESPAGESELAAEPASSAAQRFRPTNRPPMGVLKLYLDGSPSFSPIPVYTDRFLIGRTQGDLKIQHDPRISGQHVEIQRRRSKSGTCRWYLVDKDSTNGTFVRVDHAVLKHNDEVIIGRERYRFLSWGGQPALAVVSDDSNDVWKFQSNVNWLGRGVVGVIDCMRDDPFVEPQHAVLRARANQQWVIVNNDSLNGLWYRISEIPMAGNCSFQVGEQRFGFRS